MIVLDEADEMLDMGFYQDVRWILDGCRAPSRCPCFRPPFPVGGLWISAGSTLAPELEREPVAESKPRITQYCIKCSGRERIETLINLLKREEYRRSMVAQYQTAPSIW